MCFAYELNAIFLQNSKLENFSSHHKSQDIFSNIFPEKNPCVSGPVQFKPMLSKGHLYMDTHTHMYIIWIIL